MDQRSLFLQNQWFPNSFLNLISDDYEIFTSRILGSSTFGKVIKARHRASKQMRAIKIIPKKKVKQFERFKMEVDILRNLNHPSLARVFETYEDPRNVYVVMELCEGEQLFSKLFQSGSTSEEKVRKIFKQIVMAINVCHMNGVCHRDLKPESCLFLSKADNNTVKIIDFGLSMLYIDDMIKKKNKRFILTTRPGQPFFIAPEVLAGKHGVTCDIWAAGVILYIMLTGYPPFQGESTADVFDAVLAYDYGMDNPQFQQVSDGARDLIKKIFVPAGERLSAQGILGHPWILNIKPENSFLNINDEHFKQLLKKDQLKKLTLNFIATQMNQQGIVQLKELFKQLDINEDGEITIDEMKEALTNKVNSKQKEDIEEILKYVQTEGANSINYLEFMAMAVEQCLYHQEENLYQMFRILDMDSSGKISSEDLIRVFGESPRYENVKKEYWQELISQVDKSGEDKIDYLKFIEQVVRKIQ